MPDHEPIVIAGTDLNSLQPDEILTSESQKIHFAEVVPALDALGATRRGSREVTSADGNPYVVDVYTLPDGRELLAGYMDPHAKAVLDGISRKVEEASLLDEVRRVVALVLEVPGGPEAVAPDDELAGSKLQSDPLNVVELIMKCEEEFGVSFGDADTIALDTPGFTVADLEKQIAALQKG